MKILTKTGKKLCAFVVLIFKTKTEIKITTLNRFEVLGEIVFSVKCLTLMTSGWISVIGGKIKSR